MRTVLVAAAMLSMAGAADGQQRIVMHGPGASYPQPMPGGVPAPHPGPMMHPGPMQSPPGQAMSSPGRQWGGRQNGYWIGGMRAPGGYQSYRRPYRGYVLPSYWSSPSFFITDWSSYGLQQPPYGYRWSRYYDDAVLVDDRGSVFDTTGGIDWDRYDGDQRGGYDSYSSSPSYSNGYGAGYGSPSQGNYNGRGSNGVGGALVGGAIGGIAGGLIAGRHDKVGGALIGAGAGALTGYAIDKSANRGHYAPPPRDYPPIQPMESGADYPPPPYPSGHDGFAPPTVIHSGGGTTVTTTTSGGVPGGTYVDGYYYPPATVTTVTVASAPSVTTTTEIFEDTVTYSRPVMRKVYRKRIAHRPVPRCYCRR